MDKPRFYNPAGQRQGGLMGQNKILKLPPPGNTLCCFHVCSFFIMALERITQSPSIVSADFLWLPGTFGSALIYRVKLRPCASAPVLMGALSTEKE